jgi:5'-nucleotidase
VRVLLTNDDGIAATGLHAMRRELLKIPGVELAVIAPDGNRSATARSITTRRPLRVTEVDFGDGTHGYACDGMPVDCVRLAKHGLVDGFDAELIVSGINHGSNLGDDVTYSGTVAAALEGLVLGIGGLAVSQQSAGGEYDFISHAGDEGFSAVAAFAAGLVSRWNDIPLRPATLVNVNGPAQTPKGVAVTRLGKRIYREELVDLGNAEEGGRHIRIYGQEPSHHPAEGTDLQAVEDGFIAVTPIHYDLTDHAGIAALQQADLEALAASAAG